MCQMLTPLKAAWRNDKMVVEQAVTNQVVDMGLLMQTAETARDSVGVETIDVVADGLLQNRGHRGL